MCASRRLPKLVLTDIDGVWTDGGMYYTENGDELKKFNTSDSAGIIFCRMLDIPVGIVTGEDTRLVERRAEKLKIDYLFKGVRNKRRIVEELLSKLNLEWDDLAYIGDDINDIDVLKDAGFSAAPFDAPEYVKKYTSIELSKKGGEGVFREFVETILGKEGVNEAIEKFRELMASR